MDKDESAATCTRDYEMEWPDVHCHHDDLVFELEPFHHFATFSLVYRKLLIGPALTRPLRVWTVDGYRTIPCSSGVHTGQPPSHYPLTTKQNQSSPRSMTDGRLASPAIFAQ